MNQRPTLGLVAATMTLTTMTMAACRDASNSGAPSPAAPIPAMVVGPEGTATGAAPERAALVQGARFRATDVTWPRADSIDRGALAALPDAATAKVARASVPVIVPKGAAMLAKATVIAEPLFYAFFASIKGVNVSLQGTRGAYGEADAGAMTHGDEVRGHPATVSETDRIWTASWLENGVAYALSIECAQADDARCRTQSYVLELAERLAYVGGEGAR